jgi:ornithine cyclodeaminase/alanine dehydrogenase-like protein (mu-crystallin family)
MKIFELDDIMAVFDEAAALAAVERGFIAFGAGRARIGDAGHFTFDDANGDCHVKVGHVFGDDIFVVKVAAGFYGNARLGLPSSQGFVAVLSATTGEALAILNDRGRLTALRTAMAGVLAARAIGYVGGTVGIVGTGEQAQLQAEYISRHLGAERVLIWGRDSGRAQALAATVGGEASELPALVEQADLIVTTTPSTEPLVRDGWVRPGTRIIAVGADGGGKHELDTAILARAAVVVDSAPRCIKDGEAGWAVRAGLLDPATLIDLGSLLAAPRAFAQDQVVVADLTGLAVQDSAIAGTVWRALAG